MDPEMAPAAPGVPEGRTDAFNAGQSGGLAADSARYNAMVPRESVPQSVLQNPRTSMNGMSAGDYERVLPGGLTLPTAKGSSEQSYQQSMILRLRGQGV